MAIRLDVREGVMAVKHAGNSASWGAVGWLQKRGCIVPKVIPRQ